MSSNLKMTIWSSSTDSHGFLLLATVGVIFKATWILFKAWSLVNAGFGNQVRVGEFYFPVIALEGVTDESKLLMKCATARGSIV